MSIRLVMADDHALLREGIRARLGAYEDIEVLGEASNGKEALTLIREKDPDLILLDLSMPTMSGLEVARELKQAKCRTKVLILSMHENPEYVRQMIASGVRGFVLKDSSSDDLVRAIREVASGHAFFSPRISKELLEEKAVTPEQKLQKRALSKREMEILSLIAGSLRNKEIAEKLGLSVRTVETHRSRIMKKLGVDNVASLTRYAVSLGIVANESDKK